MDAVVEFASENGVTWTKTEAEEALLAFLGDSGLDVLFAGIEDTIIPATDRSQAGRYVISRFVQMTQRECRDLLESLEVIIHGILLANALYMPDPGRIGERFRRTTVYLDTALIIYALGHAGPDRQAPAAEIITLLQRHGATLACYDCTLNEIRRVLDGTAARIRRGQLKDARSDVLEYFVAKGATSSDVDLHAARVEARLRYLGVSVQERPEYEPTFVIDEKGFEDYLMEKIGYQNQATCQHDVDCIAAIARERRNRHAFTVERAGAIFVTTNLTLARAARGFFQADAPQGAVALCISDYAMANLLWLKGPTDGPDLARRRILADAYAAMQPPDELWAAYLAEITRLQERGDITEEDYYLLRHAQGARAALMDITKGESAAFAEGTVSEVLEVAKQNIRSDLQADVASERSLRETAETKIFDSERKLATQRGRIDIIGARLAMVVVRPIAAIALLLLVFGTIVSFPWALPRLQDALFPYVGAVAQFALLVWLLYALWRGASVRHLIEIAESGLAKRVRRILCGWLLIPSTGESEDKDQVT